MTHDPTIGGATPMSTPGGARAAHASGGAITAHDHSDNRYLDWPAVLAGTVFAAALSLIMLGFGAAVGLSMTSPYAGEGASATWLAIVAGLWFLWVVVSSFGAGGYVAGRLRHRIGDATTAEVEVRDGAHGLIVWATGAVLGAMLGFAGVGGVVGAGGAAAGRAVEAVSEVDVGYYARVMMRGAEIDEAAQSDIAGIVGRVMTEGQIQERDRIHIAGMIAERTDLDQAEARARVDETIAEVESVRAEALAAVERARVAGVVMGFAAAAALLAAAVAAFFAATLGGRHRDEGLGWDALPLKR